MVGKDTFSLVFFEGSIGEEQGAGWQHFFSGSCLAEGFLQVHVQTSEGSIVLYSFSNEAFDRLAGNIWQPIGVLDDEGVCVCSGRESRPAMPW